MVKHAQATTVTVQLGVIKGIGLSVIDNGKGFDPQDLRTHQQGLGLSSTEERCDNCRVPSNQSRHPQHRSVRGCLAVEVT